jgi:hypothetical protein
VQVLGQHHGWLGSTLAWPRHRFEGRAGQSGQPRPHPGGPDVRPAGSVRPERKPVTARHCLRWLRFARVLRSGGADRVGGLSGAGETLGSGLRHGRWLRFARVLRSGGADRVTRARGGGETPGSGLCHGRWLRFARVLRSGGADRVRGLGGPERLSAAVFVMGGGFVSREFTLRAGADCRAAAGVPQRHASGASTGNLPQILDSND